MNVEIKNIYKMHPVCFNQEKIENKLSLVGNISCTSKDSLQFIKYLRKYFINFKFMFFIGFFFYSRFSAIQPD